MGKICYSRVLLGGLLAGVVVNLFEFLHNLVMKAQWEAAVKPLGLSMQLSTGGIVFYIVLCFVIGIAIVWFYAAARPRFGPGAKTAALTGLAFGIICYAIPNVGWGAFTKLPWGLTTIAIVWSLVETVVASLLGAWPYKE